MIPRPNKTLADYFAISISPALIMVLVGSLCFFLVEVFYRGEAIGSVRWVLFWFVIASVLVARIGIEQGKTHAAIYGIALGAATCLYLAHVQPAWLLGAILLGIIWWCAHKLTWDCTLIDDEQDASGRGLLQTALKKKHGETISETPTKPPKLSASGKKALHPPGVWLIYFSLAALPLFGIGQMLLPAGDLGARHIGFQYLFAYLCAAIGLLLTTSFLGLRRYLRQRYLPMPANVAFGWLKFGAGVAAIVLFVTLLIPRPGATDAWGTLRYHIDYQLRRASRYAMRFNPHGSGQSNSGHPSNAQSSNPQSQNGQQKSNSGKNTPDQSGNTGGQTHSPSDKTSPNSAPPGDHSSSAPQSSNPRPRNDRQKSNADKNAPDQSPNSGVQTHSSPGKTPPLSGPASWLYQLLKWLLLLAVAGLIAWWLFRRRELLLQMLREFWAALVQFFRNLFGFKLALPGAKIQKAQATSQPFAAYQNPFATGEDRSWTRHQLILYSYEALQCWAAEQGIKAGPEQTAREFCGQLSGTFSEIAPALDHLAILHGHASYGTSIPNSYNPEMLRQVWDYMSATRLQTAQAA